MNFAKEQILYIIYVKLIFLSQFLEYEKVLLINEHRAVYFIASLKNRFTNNKTRKFVGCCPD